MLLDLKPLFSGSRDTLSVEFEMDLSEFDFLGVKPFRSPVAISGKIVSRAGIVESQLDCKVSYVGFCDRCLNETTVDYIAKINRTIVVSLEDEDSVQNDDVAVVPDMKLDLEDFCYDDIAFLRKFFARLIAGDFAPTAEPILILEAVAVRRRRSIQGLPRLQSF